MRLLCLHFWLSVLSLVSFAKPALAQVNWGWEEVVDKSKLPGDALYFGPREARSYACTAYYEGEFYNGKVSRQQCSFAFQGEARNVENFWILRGSRLRWTSFYKADAFPESLVYAAGVTAGKIPVCAVKFRDEYAVGSVRDKLCYIAWGSQEFYFGFYSLAVSDN